MITENAMLIQDRIFAVSAIPLPVSHPLLASISFDALLASTNATIAGITGIASHATIASTNATMALLFACGRGWNWL
jgi:hypothetical protein